MNTRERIIKVLDILDMPGRQLLDHHKLKALMKDLLAGRPYEPGDKIQVSEDENFVRAGTAEFYCVHPRSRDVVMARILDSDTVRMWENHRPLPRHRRLKPVPVEVIDDAKEARKAFGLVAHGSPSEVKGFKALKWLANPENWEADND